MRFELDFLSFSNFSDFNLIIDLVISLQKVFVIDLVKDLGSYICFSSIRFSIWFCVSF